MNDRLEIRFRRLRPHEDADIPLQLWQVLNLLEPSG